MDFIDALQELVTAMPAFREESTVEEIRAAFEQERADRQNREDLEEENKRLSDAVDQELTHDSGIPDGDR